LELRDINGPFDSWEMERYPFAWEVWSFISKVRCFIVFRVFHVMRLGAWPAFCYKHRCVAYLGHVLDRGQGVLKSKQTWTMLDWIHIVVTCWSRLSIFAFASHLSVLLHSGISWSFEVGAELFCCGLRDHDQRLQSLLRRQSDRKPIKTMKKSRKAEWQNRMTTENWRLSRQSLMHKHAFSNFEQNWIDPCR